MAPVGGRFTEVYGPCRQKSDGKAGETPEPFNGPRSLIFWKSYS